MNVELWVDGGAIKKLKANKALLGLHHHPADGKAYISAQLDDRELHLLNTLIYIDDGTEFKHLERKQQ